jgi:PAS domain S-box-containing protein
MKETKTINPSAKSPQSFSQIIADHIPFPAWLKDDKGRYLAVNEAFLQLFQLSREVILLRKDEEVFPPELALDYVTKDRAAMVNGKELRSLDTIEITTGQRLRVESTRTPLYESDGSVSGIVGIMRVLQSSQIGSAQPANLRPEPGLLSSALTKKPVSGIFRTDIDGHIVSVNTAAARIMGFSSSDELLTAISATKTDFFVNSQDYRHLSDAAKVNKVVDGFETELYTRDHEVIKVLLSLEPIKGSEGYQPGFEGTIQDITAQLRAEGNLLQAEEKYRNIFENAIEGIFQARPDGRIISANPALARILGYESPVDLINSITDMGAQIYASEKRYREYLHLMEIDGLVRDFEVQVHCKDGSMQWVSINARTVNDDEGYPLFYEGTVESITERKKLEAQLRHAQKMESIGTLAGGVAHDFNNILTTIMGYCSLIMMKAGKGNPALGYIDQIMEAANRASALTQSLLSFSRKQVSETKNVDVNETIKSVEKLLRRIIGEDIELVTSLCSEKLFVTVGDGHVGQLLMNLATNAKDAMPEGGILTIKTEQVHLSADFLKTRDGREGVYAAIEVTDTGEGMDEKTKDKVFDPFFTTKEVGKGTGLGLSIVYGIVKQNKGYINIVSQPGRGTTFTAYLPLTDTSVIEGLINYRTELRGGNETILVVEDSIQVREIVTTTLRDFGYTVIEAFDGADAIEKFTENRQTIDLLLLDVIMPRKNGKEALLEIKKVRPDIKAIFMSGYTGDVLTRKGISRVGIPMISKPIVIEKLLKELRDVLDKSPSQLTLFP